MEPEVLNALRRWARDELRSVNGQVEYLLRRALIDAGRLRAGPPQPTQDGPTDPPSAADS